MSDSCGIFRVGPCRGVRMCYDASVFGVTQTPLPDNCRKVDRIVKNEKGQDRNLGPYPIEAHHDGQGYHISTFQPKQPLRRNKLIENSFTPALQWNAAAQLEMVRLAPDQAYFPFGINPSMGDYSWDLPMVKISKQKPCKFQLFDHSLKYHTTCIKQILLSFFVRAQEQFSVSSNTYVCELNVCLNLLVFVFCSLLLNLSWIA